MVSRRVQTVTGKDVLELHLLANGGAGIYITRKLQPLTKGVCSGYMSENYVELQGVDAKLAQGSELVEWDSETKGFVLNGTAEFEGSVKVNKDYSLRFFYAAEEPWTLEYECCGVTERVNMPASRAIRDFCDQKSDRVTEKRQLYAEVEKGRRQGSGYLESEAD